VRGGLGDEVSGRVFPQCVTAEEAGEGVVVVDVLGVAEYELPVNSSMVTMRSS
jgi:hypothetical protein